MRLARFDLGAAWSRERDALAAALFPPVCWLCRARRTVDGLGCPEHALRPSAFDAGEARCPSCLARLPRGIVRGPCATCRRAPRGHGRLVAFGAYRSDQALREWILAFKHGGRPELARPLASLLAPLCAAVTRGGVLVPVPLHPLRQIERGYDQARLLARALREELGLELVPALRRVRWTPPQGAAGARSRVANVDGAFRATRAAERLAGRALWLVDDVVTSGATAAACARVLRAAGAARVDVLALARADHDAEREADHDAERGGEDAGDDARDGPLDPADTLPGSTDERTP